MGAALDWNVAYMYKRPVPQRAEHHALEGVALSESHKRVHVTFYCSRLRTLIGRPSWSHGSFHLPTSAE